MSDYDVLNRAAKVFERMADSPCMGESIVVAATLARSELSSMAALIKQQEAYREKSHQEAKLLVNDSGYYRWSYPD